MIRKVYFLILTSLLLLIVKYDFYTFLLGRRIGIGNGLCDLEFAILSNMNMVTDKTVVVTIVHDAQVCSVNYLKKHLFV